MAIKPFLLPLSAALLGLLEPAAASGFLSSHAVMAIKRKEEEGAPDWPILQPVRDDLSGALAGHRSHRSHSSHRSHRSHYSGSSSSYSSSSASSYSEAYTAPAAPPPPKPGVVSLVAYPGGKIYVDGRLVGMDATRKLALTPGSHSVRVENRFLGNTDVSITIEEGQTGVLNVEW